MKKFLVLFAAIAICCSFISCTDEESEDSETYIIDVSPSESSLIISIPYVDGTSYINIFRKSKSEPSTNIGQIIPYYNNVNKSFVFEDKLVIGGAEYSYSARYKIGYTTTVTGWSDFKKISGTGLTANPTAELSDVDAYLFFEKETGLMTLKASAAATVSVPAAVPPATSGPLDAYHLGLAVSNGKTATVYTINPVAKGGLSTSSTPISLHSVLSKSYFNVPLSIKGLVYELKTVKYEKDGDTNSKIRYTTINWSLPKAIDVKTLKSGGGEEKAQTITVNLSTSDDKNYDYSDRSLRYEEEPILDYSN